MKSLRTFLRDLGDYIDAWRGRAHCVGCDWTGPTDLYSSHWWDEHPDYTETP